MKKCYNRLDMQTIGLQDCNSTWLAKDR